MNLADASKNNALAQAIGTVAIESSCLDEVLRRVLDSLTGEEPAVSLLFEGQSTEWLTKKCLIILDQADLDKQTWSAERHAEFKDAIYHVGNLRDLRSWVIHGTWSTKFFDDAPMPRPWGERDNAEVYYCQRSRQGRAWGGERTFTVSDIQYLADEIRKSWMKIARICCAMYNEKDGFPPESYRGPLAGLARYDRR